MQTNMNKFPRELTYKLPHNDDGAGSHVHEEERSSVYLTEKGVDSQ